MTAEEKQEATETACWITRLGPRQWHFVSDAGTTTLFAHLTPAQQASYKQNGWFTVRGSAGGFWFLYGGYAYRAFPTGACINAIAPICTSDRLLALKLWLEWDEKAVSTVVGHEGRALR